MAARLEGKAGLDLTSLLLAARSTGPLVNGSLRRPQGIKDLANKIGVEPLGDDLGANGEPATSVGVIHRKSPLPSEVDRSTYTYAPPVTEAKAALLADPCEATPLNDSGRPPSPCYGDIDRRAYTYALGFKPRRRNRPPQRGQHSPDARSSYPSSRGRQHRAPTQASTPHVASTRANRSGEFSTMDPGIIDVVGEAWAESPHAGRTGIPVAEQARPRPGSAGPISREQSRRKYPTRSSSVTRIDARVWHGGSRLHEYLHGEGRSREERLRAKQEERNRELTFQPNLSMTTRYCNRVESERRRRIRSAPPGGNASVDHDHKDTETGGLESTDGNGIGIEHRGVVQQRQRFELLYEDSKAQRMRVQRDALKIPAACTFQPKLVAHHKQTSRERAKAAHTKRSRRTEPPDAELEENHDNRKNSPRHLRRHSSSLHVGVAFREAGAAEDNEEHRSCASASSEVPSAMDEENRGKPVSCAERLHRGGQEQRNLWAERREERTRLELEGCTFRPKLKVVPFGEADGRERRKGLRVTKTRIGRHNINSNDDFDGVDGPAFERLYRAAEVMRARREAVVIRSQRAETEGCTFQPHVRGLAERRPTSPRRTPRSSASSTAVPEQSNRDKSVYDRLSQAGRDMLRRKALRDKAIPPGCTFKPSVNPYKPKDHPRAWATPPPGPSPHAEGARHEAGAGTMPPLPPHPFVNPDTTIDSADMIYVKDVSKFGWGAAGAVPEKGTGEDNVATNKVHESRLQGCANGLWSVSSVRDRDVGHQADMANREDDSDVRQSEEPKGIDSSAAVTGKVPYVYMDANCFSPRRRKCSKGAVRDTPEENGSVSTNPAARGPATQHIEQSLDKKQQAQETTSASNTVSLTTGLATKKAGKPYDLNGAGKQQGRPMKTSATAGVSLQRRVEDRLHELGAEMQRRRNRSPRDPSIVQRQMEEDRELQQCTFEPMSYTKGYGKRTVKMKKANARNAV